MNTETFPRTVWRLTPGYQPREVTVIGKHKPYSQDIYTTKLGSTILCKDTWPTKEDAIAAGHARLDQQLLDMEKKQATISKRRTALNRATLLAAKENIEAEKK